mmetsp:Transcript_24640/g.65087  ORF Transcript_24640/g.65087 Transcript_24640/m.65087 type:complete len:175 (+) Transcript_24640:73-597(+)
MMSPRCLLLAVLLLGVATVYGEETGHGMSAAGSEGEEDQAEMGGEDHEDDEEKEDEVGEGEEPEEEGGMDSEMEDPAAIMKNLDTDEDGKLSIEELVPEPAGEGEEEDEDDKSFYDKLREHFKTVDKDGDGKLDIDELPKLLELMTEGDVDPEAHADDAADDGAEGEEEKGSEL